MSMRPAARLLLVEADALRPILDGARSEQFDLPTVCTGWSVRDVLAHCGAALTMVAEGPIHRFTPEDNQRDVDRRKGWPLDDVLTELFDGYEGGAAAIEAAGGRLDGVGLGEWIHGGDVREPLGAPDPYASAGVEIALPLLLERSVALAAVAVEVRIAGAVHQFGVGDSPATLDTDVETLVRLCSGRRPDPNRYDLRDASVEHFVLFT